MASKMSKRPTEAQFRKAAIEAALSFCPPILPCGKCGWPAVKGYCCNHCGDAMPSLTPENDPNWPGHALARRRR
jgi:hypothetical protein